MTDDLEKRLREIVRNPGWMNVDSFTAVEKAADALAAKDARIAELEKALKKPTSI